MTQLGVADLRGALELIRRVEAVPDLRSFHTEALAALRDLLPCDIALLELIDPVGGRAERHELPAGTTSDQQAEAFELYMHQHPVLAHVARTRDPTPLRISDFIGRRELHRLDFYDGVLRPAGIEHQIALTVPVSPPLVLGITLNRGRGDFTARDRALLSLLRPHLTVAARSAELRQLHLASQRLTEASSGVALVSSAGPILAATAAAGELLSAYFDGSSRPPYPRDDLEGWIAAQLEAKRGEEPVPPAPPLRVEGHRGRLTARLLPGGDDGEPKVLLLSESRPAVSPAALRRHGLTRREVEVLALVARGEPDKRVALELGISLRTVQKHLERTYAKLGVSSRTEAVAAARELSERAPEDR